MQLRCNERCWSRARRLQHILAPDSHAQVLHLDAMQSPIVTVLDERTNGRSPLDRDVRCPMDPLMARIPGKCVGGDT